MESGENEESENQKGQQEDENARRDFLLGLDFHKESIGRPVFQINCTEGLL
jgi:hypothetical protein